MAFAKPVYDHWLLMQSRLAQPPIEVLLLFKVGIVLQWLGELGGRLWQRQQSGARSCEVGPPCL
jgi:hypothetical protein